MRAEWVEFRGAVYFRKLFKSNTKKFGFRRVESEKIDSHPLMTNKVTHVVTKSQTNKLRRLTTLPAVAAPI